MRTVICCGSWAAFDVDGCDGAVAVGDVDGVVGDPDPGEAVEPERAAKLAVPVDDTPLRRLIDVWLRVARAARS